MYNKIIRRVTRANRVLHKNSNSPKTPGINHIKKANGGSYHTEINPPSEKKETLNIQEQRSNDSLKLWQSGYDEYEIEPIVYDVKGEDMVKLLIIESWGPHGKTIVEGCNKGFEEELDKLIKKWDKGKKTEECKNSLKEDIDDIFRNSLKNKKLSENEARKVVEACLSDLGFGDSPKKDKRLDSFTFFKPMALVNSVKNTLTGKVLSDVADKCKEHTVKIICDLAINGIINEDGTVDASKLEKRLNSGKLGYLAHATLMLVAGIIVYNLAKTLKNQWDEVKDFIDKVFNYILKDEKLLAKLHKQIQVEAEKLIHLNRDIKAYENLRDNLKSAKNFLECESQHHVVLTALLGNIIIQADDPDKAKITLRDIAKAEQIPLGSGITNLRYNKELLPIVCEKLKKTEKRLEELTAEYIQSLRVSDAMKFEEYNVNSRQEKNKEEIDQWEEAKLEDTTPNLPW
ncbi:hypothetical protein [Legionella sainthelensi]|uniref:Uncharacterized protein n=1 Tax=Legionella sainthelensi TaxID=28087 RepID=A0A2H5FM27_9GAMM|nr:hypothetical protein [Legionella sainthelensi]AUH72594.1 hypothetical protein CAB17_11420 [Legionella sainthelensi]